MRASIYDSPQIDLLKKIEAHVINTTTDEIDSNHTKYNGNKLLFGAMFSMRATQMMFLSWLLKM